MTVTTPPSGGSAAGSPGSGGMVPHEDLVTVTIDGFEISVPKGTLVIRAAEMLGIQIPRFCDHPLLDPVGACRQCLVDVEGQRKPLASCTTHVTEGMVVKTQLTSPVADKAQQGIMEFLLVNHPLDCPVCDKGGECPLQNQAMSNGRAESRFVETKRLFEKPINISSQVLLDRERCVLCARCTRFSQQIAGDPFIEMFERGALQQVAVYEKEPFESYFSGNTIQICPVGALTSAAYRFRSRPFDLVSSPSVCEHCASGCALRTDHRRGKVMRRLAWEDPAVNEEWNCDKGRFAFRYATLPTRITHPMVRDEGGELTRASWQEALAVAADGLAKARGRAGVLTGGRLTLEDAYGYAKFARTVLDTNDVDFRARPHSAEEAEFLASTVAGHGVLNGDGVTYAELEKAPAVLLAGFEPEEESPIVYLRLRKAARRGSLKIFSVAPFVSDGLRKLNGSLLMAAPGTEPEVLDAIAAHNGAASGEASAVGHDLPDATMGNVARALRESGAVVLVGERLAGVPGALSALLRMTAATGARLAWVPRRAGDRGAVEAGALPNLLPGGRPVADADARAEVAHEWGVSALPATPGRDTDAIIRATGAGELGALLVAGVEVEDLVDPAAAIAALESVPFLVSIELMASAVTERADVVLPIVPVAEKTGSFLDWEGRLRPFEQALRGAVGMSDVKVLGEIADRMDAVFGLTDEKAARTELLALGRWSGRPVAAPDVTPGKPLRPAPGQAVLATWRLLLDHGRLQDGEPHLAATARAPHVRLSAATAAEIGVADGDTITVESARGAVSAPLHITEMPDRVVWLPANSVGAAARADLRAVSGSQVRIKAGGAA